MVYNYKDFTDEKSDMGVKMSYQRTIFEKYRFVAPLGTILAFTA